MSSVITHRDSEPPLRADEAKPVIFTEAGLMTPWQFVTALSCLVGSLALAGTLNNYYVFVLANVALLAMIGIGLNILIGLSGQVSFGHVGFYALGAYIVAVLTTRAGFGFWVAWPLAAASCAFVGTLLAMPSLRVKGPYLAMVTIAFGFIVEHSAVEMSGLTGGQNGIMGIVGPSLGPLFEGERAVAFIAIVAAAISLLSYAVLSRGNWGAALRAVRDGEIASESIGLNPLVIKTVAFSVSALLAGLAGGLYAPLSGFVTPSSFGFIQSILFVLVVMIGGAGTLLGPIVGAVIVGVLPELLAHFEDLRLLIFGVLLLVVLWSAPNGVVGLLNHLRSLLMHRFSGKTQVPEYAVPVPDIERRVRRPLRADSLSMKFGGVWAVKALSFTVNPASITSLIGPNGAGKSTVINMLGGFYTPTEGRVFIGDDALHGKTAFAIARAGIARTYQTSQLFGSLSVLDNVALALPRGDLGALLSDHQIRSQKARWRAARLLRWCGFEGRLQQPASGLAHVDRRLVEIARGMATDPDVLLLDEPAAGLSREDKARLALLLRRIADAGIGVVLVEHDMALVMEISDQVVVIDAGTYLASGSAAEVQNNPAVKKAYLGESGLADLGVDGPKRSAGVTSEILGVGRLTTGYGAEPVLHAVDLSVIGGHTVALLGANGAGKTTLMRSLMGLHRPVQGSIHLGGTEISAKSTEEIVSMGLVLVPEGRQVFPELSVLDNIRLGAFLKPEARDARMEEMLVRFPRLRERLYQRAGLLSGGEQQMLAIARALMARPSVLILDEPSLGLAPKVIEELFRALRQLRDDGMTLVIVDQMAALALALSDEAYVFENGRVVAQGPSSQMASDPALARAYLGAH